MKNSIPASSCSALNTFGTRKQRSSLMVRRSETLKILILCLLLTCIIPFSLITAESRSVGGLSFHLDELVEVDSELSQLTVLGKTHIVRNSRLDLMIVEAYFNEENFHQRFSVDALTRFIGRSLATAQFDLAALGVNAFLNHPETTLDNVLKLVSFLEHQANGASFLATFLEGRASETKGEYAQTFLCKASWFVLRAAPQGGQRTESDDPLMKALQNQQVSVRYFSQISCFDEVRASLAEAFDTNDADELQRIRELAVRHFSSNDGRVQEVITAQELFLRIQRTESLNEFDQLQMRIKEELHRPALFKLLNAALLKVLHSKTAKALESREITQAFEYLSRIDFTERTPLTHELMLQATQQLDSENIEILLSPSLGSSLLAIAGQDERVRDEVLKVFEGHVKRLIDKGQVQRVEYYLNKIYELRPDPNSKNDELRFSEAVAWLSVARTNQAERSLSSMSNPPSLFQRIRLVFAGYYFNFDLLLLAFLMIVLISFASYLYSKPHLLAIFSDKSKAAANSSVGDFVYSGEVSPRNAASLQFINLQSHHKASKFNQEYAELLKSFDLSPNSGLREIKAAYRNAIKEVHPDLQKSEEHTEQFMNIKTNYDRILELRKQLGMKSEA